METIVERPAALDVHRTSSPTIVRCLPARPSLLTSRPADGRIYLQMNLMVAEYFRERTREGWETSLT